MIKVSHMQNDRMIRGPALGFKNLHHRLRIKSIPTQSIDRLRWQSDQVTMIQCLGSLCNRLGSIGQKGCTHRRAFFRQGRLQHLGQEYPPHFERAPGPVAMSIPGK